MFPSFTAKDGVHTLVINPLSGESMLAGVVMALPQTLRRHRSFRAVFGARVSQGVLNEEGFFTVKDPQGTVFYLGMKDDESLIIQRQIDGQWYQYMTPESFKTKKSYAMQGRHLTERYTHWLRLDGEEVAAQGDEIMLCERESGQLCYLATKDFGYSSIRAVTSLETGHELRVGTSFTDHFERSEYVERWFDGSKLCSLNFPRFELSFKRHMDRLYCEQEPGFFLAEDQIHPALDRLPRRLLLQNDKGELRVLVAHQPLRPPCKNSTVDKSLKAQIKTKSKKKFKQCYRVFQLDEERGRLVSQEREANLYNAALQTGIQNHEEAAYLLRHFGRKLTPYTSDEQASLVSIANMQNLSGEASGNTRALSVYASYLLAHNACMTGSEVHPSIQKLLENNYTDYLAHLKHASVLRLTHAEELFCLRQIEDGSVENYVLSPSLKRRLKFLGHSKNCDEEREPRLLSLELKEPGIEFKKDQRVSSLTWGRGKFEGPWGNTSRIPATRIVEVINEDPSAAFRWFISEKGQSHKVELLKKLNYGIEVGPKMGRALCLLFKTILSYPDPFRKLDLCWRESRWDDPVNYADNGQKIIKKAQELALEHKLLSKKKDPLKLQVPELLSPPAQNEELALPKLEFAYNKVKEEPVDLQITFKSSNESLEKAPGLESWLEKTRLEGDSLFNTQIKVLEKDLETFYGADHSVKTAQVTEKGALETLKTTLQEQIETLETSLSEARTELLRLANREFDELTDMELRRLSLSADSARSITLDDLLVAYARRDGSKLAALNPALTQVEMAELSRLLGSYLLEATRQQHLKRITHRLTNYESCEKGLKQHALAALTAELQGKRHYTPHKHPAYLVFEYYGDILMREKQVKSMELLLNNREKGLEAADANPVMEMIMGSGKSKVLLVLLSLLHADKDHLSMLLVPEALYETVASDTQVAVERSFGQQLRALHFDRNSRLTRGSLQMILDELHTAKDSCDAVIMTSKSLRCLLLKFIEMGYQEVDKQKQSPELKLLSSVIELLAKSGYPVLDEIDTLLSVRHEVSFSVGKKMAPRLSEVELISRLYTCLNSVRSENEGAISHGRYEELKPQLITAFVSAMKKHKLTKTRSQGAIQQFFQKSGSEQWVRDYLAHKPTHEAKKMYEQESKAVQNVLALAGQMISDFLPHTLTRVCDINYGVGQLGGRIAMPYKAANTPSYGSLFANQYIRMAYTFQYYLEKKVSLHLVASRIKGLQNQALEEMRCASDIALEDTAAYKEFCKLKGELDLPLFGLGEAAFEQVTRQVNKTPQDILKFVEKAIIPQIQLHEERLPCSPHALVGFLKGLIGFTGTLWNAQSLHTKLTCKPDPGTDAKTLDLLWKHSQDVCSLKEEGVKTLMELNPDMIADAGGYLKDQSNREVASAMLEHSPADAVVFFNKKNELTVRQKNKKDQALASSNLAAGDYKSFLDQAHTTGTDVKHKPDAVAIVTIGKYMLLRDLLQSVWRLRGLDKGQKVKLVINAEVSEILKEVIGQPQLKEIKLEHVLHYCIKNQSAQQARDNLRAMQAELKSIPQILILQALLDPERRQWAASLRNRWFKCDNGKPGELYGNLAHDVERDILIGRERAQATKEIEHVCNVLKVDSNSPLEQMKGVLERFQTALPDTVNLRGMGCEETVEVEQELEQELENEQEIESIRVQARSAEHLGEIGLTEFSRGFLCRKIDEMEEIVRDKNPTRCPVFRLDDAMSEVKDDLKKYAKYFKGVYICMNVLEWPECSSSDRYLLGNHRTPFHWVVKVGDGWILLSHKEAQHVWSVSSTRLQNKNITCYNLFYDADKIPPAVAVRLKFLNGESSYSRRELAFMEKWLNEDLMEMYTTKVLPGRPDKLKAYHSNSPLKRLWHELLKKRG